MDYAVNIARMFYGLPRTEFRQLAHHYALACKCSSIPNGWHTEQAASRDWYYGFMERHPNLSLKTPEGMSIARAIGFNKRAVDLFFGLYGSIMEQYHFQPDRIFNIDESALSTVMKPCKVVCERGAPVASQISQEKGVTMTFVGIISAAGTTLPPVFILPRKRWCDSFMRNTIHGSKGIVTPANNRWMDKDAFVETLKHIKDKTFCTVDNKILVIMDNAGVHKSCSAIDYCRANGIVILTLPPHTTDKMQPLDVSVYGPFKASLRTVQTSFHHMHPHQSITAQLLPEMASKAWIKAANTSNILSGFQASGIWPIDPDIFPESAFVGSIVSDQPQPGKHIESLFDSFLFT